MTILTIYGWIRKEKVQVTARDDATVGRSKIERKLNSHHSFSSVRKHDWLGQGNGMRYNGLVIRRLKTGNISTRYLPSLREKQ